MKAADIFTSLYAQARQMQQAQREHDGQCCTVATSGSSAFDPDRPILHEDLPLLFRLARICAKHMKRIDADKSAGKLTMAQAVEFSRPIEVVVDYIAARLARCTVNQWPGPGERFGRLIVVEPSYESLLLNTRTGHDRVVTCRCDCGNTIDALLGNLVRGQTTSCGCWASEAKAERATIHGDSGSRLYWIWHNMIERTTNPQAKRYSDYGGRGIAVCPEWSGSYSTFRAWALSHGYQPGLQIDRVDNSGPYSPSNCAWATRKQQCRNTRRNVIVTYNGRSMTLIEASELSRIPYGTLIRRRRDGWPESRLFDNPKHGGRRQK